MDSSLRRSRRLDAVNAGWTGDDRTARRLLVDDDPATRASALAALERLDILSIDELIAALDDDSDVVACRALRVAAASPTEWAGKVDLVPLLEHASATVVEVAAYCAGEFGIVDDATLDVLHDIASAHDEALCRESAAAALGAIGNPRSLETVIAACRDVATVRRRAVLSLAAFTDPAADDTIRGMLDDRDWQVRQAAEDLVG